MKLLAFIPIKLTILLVLGILMGYFLPIGIGLALGLSLFFLSILAFILFNKKQFSDISFGAITALTTIGIGVFIVSMAQPKYHTDHYSNSTPNEQENWKLKITEVLKSSTFSERFIADVQSYNSFKASGKIILSLPLDASQTPLQVDDELIVLAKKEEIQQPLNPHQFDYKNYLEKQGVYHQLKLNSHNFRVLKNPKRTLIGYTARLRNKISSRLRQANFGEDEFGVIQALFLGQRDDISESTYTAYKNAGAVHILAVSGLHIGILLLFLEFLLRPLELLRKGKVLKLIVIVLLLWGFAFLAGLSASVVRAVTMFSFVAYALYLNRPSNTFNILALSMFFILLVFNPMLLFDVGFQMSYAAVFAIVWIFPILQKFWNPKNGLIKKVWQLFLVSISAQIGVLPISLYYFHQFPGLFFISNLLIVPFLGLVLGMGIVIIALVLLNLAPDFLIAFYNSMISSMNAIITWVAQQEAFIFQNISFDSVQLILTSGLLISLIWVLHKFTFRRASIFLTSIICLQIWSLYSQHQTHNKAQLWIAHQTKNSVLLHQTGAQLVIYSPDSTASEKIVNDYKILENITAANYQPLVNAYNLAKGRLVVIDSLGVFPRLDVHAEYVLLTQSPKINLERLLDVSPPKAVIVDGSNYRSYIKRWAVTCDQKNIPFHYTGDKGAFMVELE